MINKLKYAIAGIALMFLLFTIPIFLKNICPPRVHVLLMTGFSIFFEFIALALAVYRVVISQIRV